MEYDQLYKNFLFNIITEMVPYVKNLGVNPVVMEPGKVHLEMPVQRNVYNHVNTAHAGALYTFLETVAGGVLVSSFDIMKISVLLKGATVEYQYPGLGTLTGKAELDEKQRSGILDALDQGGKSKPLVQAELWDEEGRPVAIGSFTYSLKKMD